MERGFILHTLRPVTELHAGYLDWQSIVELFRVARYSECVAALRRHDGFDSVALRSRALLRLERFDEALETLTPLAPASHLQMGEVSLLRAAALLSLGRFDELSRALVEARAAIYSIPCPGLEADLAYYESLTAYALGDFDEALRRSDVAAQVPSPLAPLPYFVTPAAARANALNIRAAVVAARDGREAAVEYLLEALRLCASDADIGLTAKVLANLSGSIAGHEDENFIGVVRRAYEAFPWTDDLAQFRFLVLRQLGWTSALAGDHLAAFREFKSASHVAPTAAWRVGALLDRIFLLHELDQCLAAHADLLEAQELAETVDWARVRFFEWLALASLARMLAQHDAGAARRTLSKYFRVKLAAVQSSSAATDPRFRGTELLAEAAVVRSEGDHGRAQRLYVEAFDTFTKLDIRWQAAIAALEIASLGGPERYAAFARAEAFRRPNSWLARRAADLERMAASAS